MWTPSTGGVRTARMLTRLLTRPGILGAQQVKGGTHMASGLVHWRNASNVHRINIPTAHDLSIPLVWIMHDSAGPWSPQARTVHGHAYSLLSAGEEAARGHHHEFTLLHPRSKDEACCIKTIIYYSYIPTCLNSFAELLIVLCLELEVRIGGVYMYSGRRVMKFK